MLLRSITKHVKEQNWFAVALDFFIVVVGILIAFQITNWNEARSDRAKEVQYLKYVNEDLGRDIDEYTSTIDTTEWRMAAISVILTKSVDSGMPTTSPHADGVVKIEPLPTHDFGKYALNAVDYLSTFDVRQSAFETLISTGDIGLIRNQKLVRRMQEYYAQVGELHDMEKRLANFRDFVSMARSQSGLSSLDPLTVDQLADVVSKEQEFAATLKDLWGFSEVQRTRLKFMQSQAIDLMAAVTAELEPQ